MVQIENSVTVSGLLHFIKGDKKERKYFPFSIRHENLWTDGTVRKDFLTVRAFVPEVQKQLKELDEGAAIKVEGVLRASRGRRHVSFRRAAGGSQPVTGRP